jgi:hypothetical protein
LADFVIRTIVDFLLGYSFDTDHYDLELSREESSMTNFVIAVPKESVRRRIVSVEEIKRKHGLE